MAHAPEGVIFHHEADGRAAAPLLPGGAEGSLQTANAPLHGEALPFQKSGQQVAGVIFLTAAFGVVKDIAGDGKQPVGVGLYRLQKKFFCMNRLLGCGRNGAGHGSQVAV